MNNKWKVALISGVILLFYSLYLWGVPAVINIKSNKSFIENKIFENTGYKIDLGNPELSMGFVPSIWIKSDNISLLNDDNSKALSIDNPKLKLKLLPLIQKKLEIANLSADKETFFFIYSKESKFLIGQYELKMPQAKSNFRLAKMNLDLGPYDIFLNDKKNNKKLSFRGNYLQHGKYVENKHLKISTEGIFSANNKSTKLFADVDINLPINRISEDKFKIFANIENFDLSSVSDYIGTLTKEKIKSLGGFLTINANTKSDDFGHKNIALNIYTQNLKIVGKDKASSVFYNDKIKANIDFRTVDNGLQFEEISLDAKNIHAYANGKLYDLGNKVPKYDLTAEVKDTRIEEVVAILPGSETLIPDFNLYKLKENVFYGNGEGKLRFKGSGRWPDVTGEIKLSDAYLIHPIKGANANADIDLKFSGKKMFLNVFVPTSNNQNVVVKGNVLIDGSKYSELDISSTESVDLAPAQVVLNPLHEILKFQLGPVPIMKISGLGNISMHSAGKKIDPHIWGRLNFKNATVSFNEINNLELTNGSGEVVFEDTQVTFKTYKAYINGLPLEIKGDCSVLGKLNVYVTSKGQDIKKLIKTINTSPILFEVQKVVKPFTQPSGLADIFLHIYGNAKDAEEIKFNQDLFAKGKITLHNAKTLIKDTFLPFTKVNGVVNFDKYNSDYNLNGFLRESNIKVWGTGSNNIIDLKAHSDNFKINDIFDILHPNMKLPFKNDIGKIHTSFNAHYNGKVEGNTLDYNKINVDGKFLSNISSSDVIKLDGGSFDINNGIIKTSLLKGLFNNNPFELSFSANGLEKEIMNISDANFYFKNLNLSSINSIKDQIKLPQNIEKEINNIINIKGIIDVSGNIKNNKISADTNLKGISFIYEPLSAVVRILNGRANLRNNVLYLDKINTSISSMPLFLNGKISNIFTGNPSINVSISSKLTQQFFDRVINNKSVYPIKTKGDINFKSNLTGTIGALNAKSLLNMSENSSIYFMGATIAGAPTGNVNSEGMTTNPLSIASDIILYPNGIKFNSLNFNQIITSQNKKQSVQNQLSVLGDIKLLPNNIIAFKNLKIKTDNPTNARIFNILFKKPTIKQGVFTTDLLINGTSDMPYILGYLNLSSIDVPLLNSTLRDISLDFQKDFVNVDSKAVIMTNDIFANAKIVNKPSKPIVVEDINVQMEELNLNTITSALSDLEADNTRVSRLKPENPQSISLDIPIIKNAKINADNIIIKKANATDFKTNITLDENQKLNVNNYSFNLANGIIEGDIDYDLKNYSGIATMNIKDADAQIIAENFFDMTGQVYGIVTGNLNAACTGITSIECVNTLKGEGNFEVLNGKMPKLGSLEYLLKAGNLITGGVTAVSINSIIDLITPLKTGDFNSIKGHIHVKDGIADQINVYSDGKDLNMYMTGSYNLSTLVADMEVYGSLSKNFSTLLGRIGNSSLNTLFNTIPGIKINEINPTSTSNIRKIPNFSKENILRVFKAEIYGDINGNNYVKSFKWIKD